MADKVVDPEHKKRTSEYFLTQDDFRHGVDEPKPYSFPNDIVTRDNFVPFLINSFARSRGSLLVQAAELEWLYGNKGFDYVQTLENFKQSRGIHNLSLPEHKLLESAYRSVKRHRYGSKFKIEVVLDNFEEQIYTLLNIGREKELQRSLETVKLSKFNFRAMTYNELQAWKQSELHGSEVNY